MSEELISLRGVTKIYKSNGTPVRALHGVDLTIGTGDLAVLAGPSGSGKSTLLHLVGALDKPTEGSVVVAGEDLGELSSHELASLRLKRVGFVFQSYNLIPVLTAFENVEYPLLLLKLDREERNVRVTHFLGRVGLKDQMKKRPGEMSGGEQQRVAVARALVTYPKLILADEPTANLDSETGAALIDLFRELNKQFKITFLFASHDPMVIERAHRVIRLKDGRVVS